MVEVVECPRLVVVEEMEVEVVVWNEGVEEVKGGEKWKEKEGEKIEEKRRWERS